MDHVRMIIGSTPMKKIARQKLKGHWLESAAVFIVYLIFTQGLSQLFLNSKRNVDVDIETLLSQNLVSLVSIALILGLLTFFLAPPILVGGTKYILKLIRDEDAKFSDIFYGFTCYWRGFKQYFLFNLIITLPILILIAIGIIITSSISQRVDSLLLSILVIIMILFLVWIVYAVVLKIGLLFKFFVIADEKFQYNGAIDSLKTCYSMMSGNKAHLFGIILSFIGWYLLAILPGSIFAAVVPSDTALIWGNVLTLIPLSFVTAYAYATFAVYYRILRGELKIDIVDEEPQEIHREISKEIVRKESHEEITKEARVESPENEENKILK